MICKNDILDKYGLYEKPRYTKSGVVMDLYEKEKKIKDKYMEEHDLSETDASIIALLLSKDVKYTSRANETFEHFAERIGLV